MAVRWSNEADVKGEGLGDEILQGPRDTWRPVFGRFMESGSSFRENFAVLLMLGAHPIAIVLLLIAMNLAQCNWWNDPGAGP